MQDMKIEYDGGIIPLVDLGDEHYILGPAVNEFEGNYARFCQITHCVGCSSGTAAIHLALLAIQTKPGDEVITVPNTFVGTIEPIIYTGAKIRFVDVKQDTALIDITQIEKAITKKTRAIIVVDLYGQMPDMQQIKEIAQKHSLFVIEDACQSHGAEWNGHPPGYYSDLACYSFYPSKNLGAQGDAGAVTTNDYWYDNEMRMLRNHGRSEKYRHQKVGYNYRLDTVQAEYLNKQLPLLSGWVERRRNIADFYNRHLKADYIVEADGAKHAYHLYVLKVKKRKQFIEHLLKNNIQTGVHYPVPLHQQPAYTHLNLGAYPITEKLSSEVVSIPLYPWMSRSQCIHVLEKTREALQQ